MATLNKLFLITSYIIRPIRYYSKKVLLLFVFCLICNFIESQTPLYAAVLVSDNGSDNNIGNANSSRNVAVSSNGIIYVTYTGTSGIRVVKSTNRGQSFLPSVGVSLVNEEPEILVNDSGFIYVSWVQGGNIMLSISMDEGETFSSPVIVGTGSITVHMTAFGDSIYLIEKRGQYIYANSNNGFGPFTGTTHPRRVFADILADQNGVVYSPSDNPILYLLSSTDSGSSFSSVALNPRRNVFFSSYALSDGPCGAFIFAGGGGAINSVVGYKIDVSTGINTIVNLGENFSFQGRTLFADDTGAIIDGYQNASGELVMRLSSNQGDTFDAPIVIATGNSHNITRNPLYNDVVVVYEQSGQIFVSVYDNLLRGISVVEATVPPVVCIDRDFDLEYTLSGSFAPNTMFTAYLSDASGSFENETLIGSVNSNTNGTIICKIPNTLVASDNYRVQIKSFADCTQSSAIPLKVISPSVASVSSISPICFGDDAVFTITGTPNSEVYFNGVSSSSSSPVVIDASGEAIITVIAPISNQTITLNSVNDLEGGCSTALNESSTVVVNPLPIVSLEEQYVLCINVNGTETLNPPVINTFLNSLDYSFDWYLEGDLQAQFNDLPAIAPTLSGTYTVEVTNNNTGCKALNNTTTVYESSPPVITPEIVSSAFANPQQIEVEASNTASNNAISEYEFSLNDGPWELGFGSPGGRYDFTFDDNIIIGTNTIRVRDIVGCGENEVEVTVMNYPPFFTPNNDGANDRWNIVAPKTPINYLATAQVYIYNRYGKLLKQISPSGLGWDGVFNGRLMPNDDYWFVVNFIDPLDNKSKQFKAHFALKR